MNGIKAGRRSKGRDEKPEGLLSGTDPGIFSGIHDVIILGGGILGRDDGLEAVAV